MFPVWTAESTGGQRKHAVAAPVANTEDEGIATAAATRIAMKRSPAASKGSSGERHGDEGEERRIDVRAQLLRSKSSGLGYGLSPSSTASRRRVVRAEVDRNASSWIAVANSTTR